MSDSKKRIDHLKIKRHRRSLECLKKTITNELPENYEELKKAANRSGNWRAKTKSSEELGQYNTSQVIDILKTRLQNDPVFTIQEEAYRSLLSFGEEVELPKRSKFEMIKGTSKILLRVKKSLPKDHTYEEFAAKLKRMRIDVYDAYEGDKGAEFNTWLENEWKNLETK